MIKNNLLSLFPELLSFLKLKYKISEKKILRFEPLVVVVVATFLEAAHLRRRLR